MLLRLKQEFLIFCFFYNVSGNFNATFSDNIIWLTIFHLI